MLRDVRHSLKDNERYLIEAYTSVVGDTSVRSVDEVTEYLLAAFMSSSTPWQFYDIITELIRLVSPALGLAVIRDARFETDLSYEHIQVTANGQWQIAWQVNPGHAADEQDVTLVWYIPGNRDKGLIVPIAVIDCIASCVVLLRQDLLLPALSIISTALEAALWDGLAARGITHVSHHQPSCLLQIADADLSIAIQKGRNIDLECLRTVPQPLDQTLISLRDNVVRLPSQGPLSTPIPRPGQGSLVSVEDLRTDHRFVRYILSLVVTIITSVYVDLAPIEDLAPIGHEAEEEVQHRMRNQVFISYSHKDKRLLNEFQTVMKPIVRNKTITVWDDTMIKPGTEWRAEIKKALAAAKVALLLVSPDFLASSFIADQELPPLLEAVKEEGVTILWVAVRPSMYKDTVIERYQAANDPARPLNRLSKGSRETEVVRICEKVKAAVITS